MIIITLSLKIFTFIFAEQTFLSNKKSPAKITLAEDIKGETVVGGKMVISDILLCMKI